MGNTFSPHLFLTAFLRINRNNFLFSLVSHIPDAYHQRNQSGQRRSPPHEKQRRRTHQTEAVRQRYAEEEGGNHAVHHGEHGIALPAEIGIDAEHETHHDAIYAVSPQIAGSHLHHLAVTGEDTRQRVWQEL